MCLCDAYVYLSMHIPAQHKDNPTQQGWPLMQSELWLLPSTSGAAAMSREQRWGPFEQLACRLEALGAHPGKRCGGGEE